MSSSNMSRSGSLLVLRALLLITAVYGAITIRNEAHDDRSALLRKSQEISMSGSAVTDKQQIYGTVIESQTVPYGIRRLALLLSDSAIHRIPVLFALRILSVDDPIHFVHDFGGNAQCQRLRRYVFHDHSPQSIQCVRACVHIHCAIGSNVRFIGRVPDHH